MASMTPNLTALHPPRISQQRTHERVTIKVPALLRVPETRSGTYLVTVLDASKTGLRLSCPSALAAGTRVEVRVQGTTVLGIARYTREVDREFHVGIEAEGVAKPSQPVETEEFDLTSLLLNATAGSSRRS